MCSSRTRLAESSHLENTISSPIEFAGVGLHSGAPVRMRLLPAPAGSGVIFRRTDLDNLELPILDGSALPYTQAFRHVGLKSQRRRREYLRILKDVEVRDGDK